jgi:hypothetical protein
MNGVVFNSQEFSDTSKSTGFPILIAIYKKDKIGTTYNEVYNNIFQTLEGNQFSLSEFDYISNYIQKYPNKYKIKNFDGYLFYTLRDINALKRCRTFIKENINNAIQIDNNKLDYYCYIDVFKDFAKKNIPYYLGNFDIPINNDSFKYYKDDFRLISFAKHPDIFGNSKINNLELHKNRINNYFREVMSI